MNCAINSWHLTDWTFQEFFINDIRFQDKVSVDKKGNKNFVQGIILYQQYLTKLFPELEYMRLFTNGTKHCILKDKNRKEKTITKVGDFCSSDFLEWIPFLSQKLKAVFKIIREAKFCGRIVARKS